MVHVSKKLKESLDIYIQGMREDDDLVIVIDGKEGAGKSVLARQLGYYCAEKLGTIFTVDNVHFGLNDYVDFSLDSDLYTVNVLDEARNVLNKKSSNSKVNRKFTNYLSECRKKRQVHIICLPAFHELEKYVVLWRMKFMIHVKKYFVPTTKNEVGFTLHRGDYEVYTNDKNLKWCYMNPYHYPHESVAKGHFNNEEVIDIVAYDAKKDKGTLEKYHSRFEEEQLGKLEKMWKQRWLMLVNHIRLNREISNGEIADACKMEVKTLSSIVCQSNS